MTTETTLTLRCECMYEHLDIDLFLDLDDTAYMSFSSRWGADRAWRERAKAIWMIFRGKSYYFSEVVLDTAKLTQIRDFLSDNLDPIALGIGGPVEGDTGIETTFQGEGRSHAD